MSALDADHAARVERAIAADLLSSGLHAEIAPTAAKEAAGRIFAGEQAEVVIRQVLSFYGPSAPASTGHDKVEAKPPIGMRAPPSRDRTAERIRTATAGGNPYAPGSVNLMQQKMLEYADPTLAARLKSEAGRK